MTDESTEPWYILQLVQYNPNGDHFGQSWRIPENVVENLRAQLPPPDQEMMVPADISRRMIDTGFGEVIL